MNNNNHNNITDTEAQYSHRLTRLNPYNQQQQQQHQQQQQQDNNSRRSAQLQTN